MSVDTNTKDIEQQITDYRGFDHIRSTLQGWIDFDLKVRKDEGLETDDNTHICGPTFWPTHGILTNWIQRMVKADELIHTLWAENQKKDEQLKVARDWFQSLLAKATNFDLSNQENVNIIINGLLETHKQLSEGL